MFRVQSKKRELKKAVPEIRLTESELESGLTFAETMNARRRRGLQIPRVFRLVGMPFNMCRTRDGKVSQINTEG